MWLWAFAAAAAGLVVWWLRHRRQTQLAAAATALRGKTVVVTGGGSGIGAALAERLAVEEGAEVYVWDIDSAGLANVKRRVEERGALVSVFLLDVTNKQQVSDMVALMEKRDRPVDVIVNNAGFAVCKSFLECSPEECEKTFQVNVFAHWNATRAVLPSMLRRRTGHIVCISSLMDMLSTQKLAVYTASKWAASGFMESLREELAAVDSGVDITVVRPWVVVTPLSAHVRFWNHWVRHLLPAVTAGTVAEAVIDALKLKSDIVTVPAWMAPVGLVARTLPPSWRVALQRICGLNNLI